MLQHIAKLTQPKRLATYPQLLSLSTELTQQNL